MKVLAGTSDGVYAIGESAARQVLESRCVRELVRSDGRIFAGTDAGLFISDDGGENWSPVGLADREIWQVRRAGDDILYASTQPAGLFRSEDAGLTWREVESFSKHPDAARWCLPISPPVGARARALIIDTAEPQKMWVGVEVGGIMRTEDAGETWQLGLPGGNPDLHMMFPDPAQPNVLYASTGYGRFDGVAEMKEGNAGVFRSDDGGAT